MAAAAFAAFFLLGSLGARNPAQAEKGEAVEMAAVVEAVHPEEKTIEVEGCMVELKDASLSGAARKAKDIKPGQFVKLRGERRGSGAVRARRVQVLEKNPGAAFRGYIANSSAGEVAKLKKSDKIVKDAALQEYVAGVGMALTPEWARKKYEFEFQVIEDPEVNAFAYPTGKIFVHTGLLGRVENEAQLAAVLGHEIGHVTEHHGERNFRSGLWKTGVFLTAALALDYEMERKGSSRATAAMAQMGLSLGYMAAVNGYGRNMEDQSDRVGLRYMKNAGYDVREAPGVWDLFNRVYGDTPTAVNVFYGNHSTNNLRRENQASEIKLLYRGVTEGKVNTEDYQRRMTALTWEAAKHDFEKERWEPARVETERVLRLQPEHEEAKKLLERIERKERKKKDGGEK
jgi:hypothetical protein